MSQRAFPRAYLSRSPEATERLGEWLGRLLPAGTVVDLDGDLGSGKTCLARGLALGLGVVEPVTSPTYTLMHRYAGRLPVSHFDAWLRARERSLLEGGEALEIGLEGVAMVEWAEHVADLLPLPRLAVRLLHQGLHERSIELALLLPQGESRVGSAELEAALLAVVQAAPTPELLGPDLCELPVSAEPPAVRHVEQHTDPASPPP